MAVQESRTCPVAVQEYRARPVAVQEDNSSIGIYACISGMYPSYTRFRFDDYGLVYFFTSRIFWIAIVPFDIIWIALGISGYGSSQIKF